MRTSLLAVCLIVGLSGEVVAQDLSQCVRGTSARGDDVKSILDIGTAMRETESRLFSEFQRVDCKGGCDHLEGLSSDFHSSSRSIFKLAYDSFPDDARVLCAWSAILLREAHAGAGSYDVPMLRRAEGLLAKAREVAIESRLRTGIDALAADVRELIRAAEQEQEQ